MMVRKFLTRLDGEAVHVREIETQEEQIAAPFVAADFGRTPRETLVASAPSIIDAKKKRSTEVDGRHGFDGPHF